MDLKTFVTETLQQIVAGVREAQATDGGAAINAKMKGVPGGAIGGHLINTGSGMFTCVDFDVAVSAEGSGGAKAGLIVFGVGVDAGGERKSGYANRIAFSVPLRLPDGDPGQTSSFDKPINYPKAGVA